MFSKLIENIIISAFDTDYWAKVFVRNGKCFVFTYDAQFRPSLYDDRLTDIASITDGEIQRSVTGSQVVFPIKSIFR